MLSLPAAGKQEYTIRIEKSASQDYSAPVSAFDVWFITPGARWHKDLLAIAKFGSAKVTRAGY
jgi:hypothetical protein